MSTKILDRTCVETRLHGMFRSNIKQIWVGGVTAHTNINVRARTQVLQGVFGDAKLHLCLKIIQPKQTIGIAHEH